MTTERHPPSPGDRDAKIADASTFFREESGRPRSGPAPPTSDLVPHDTYEVIGAGEVHEVEVEATSAPPMIRQAPGVKIVTPVVETRSRVRQEPSAKVEQVWSRGAEWGPNAILLAAVTLAVGFLVYLAIFTETYFFAFFVFIGGVFILIVLAYPILITLERPVRVTPELAVRDFFDSLSHHVPHYRRMWLLLSSDGRRSSYYSSYVGFRLYWGRMRRHLHRGGGAWFQPLIFKIDGFQAEKSTGKNAINARFSLSVFRREDDSANPIATYRMEMGLVKGPDRMWYLDKGTIPEDAVYERSWKTVSTP